MNTYSSENKTNLGRSEYRELRLSRSSRATSRELSTSKVWPKTFSLMISPARWDESLILGSTNLTRTVCSAPFGELVLGTVRGDLQHITNEGEGAGTRRMTVATGRKVAGSDADHKGEQREVAGEGRIHGEKQSGAGGGL